MIKVAKQEAKVMLADAFSSFRNQLILLLDPSEEREKILDHFQGMVDGIPAAMLETDYHD